MPVISRAVVCSSLLLVALAGCNVKSQGAYVRGESGSDFFAPLHLQAIDALGPKREKQHCYHGERPVQQRAYQETETIHETSARGVVKHDKRYGYNFENACEPPPNRDSELSQ